MRSSRPIRGGADVLGGVAAFGDAGCAGIVLGIVVGEAARGVEVAGRGALTGAFFATIFWDGATFFGAGAFFVTTFFAIGLLGAALFLVALLGAADSVASFCGAAVWEVALVAAVFFMAVFLVTVLSAFAFLDSVFLSSAIVTLSLFG